MYNVFLFFFCKMKFLSRPILVFLFLSSFYSHAEIINNINFIGLDKISRGTVLNYLTLEVGDDFSRETGQQALIKLYETNFFKDIKINFVDNTLSLTLVENPTVKFFEIIGFKDDEVLSSNVVDQLTKNFSLTNGKIFVEENLRELITQLQSLYSYNAYYQSNFKVSKELDDQNRIGISIQVDENEQSLIQDFKISGGSSFPEEDLLDLFNIGSPDFFLINYFTDRDHFSKKEFDAGIAKLSSFFLNNGYLDFAIEETDIQLNQDKSKISINLKISEGNQYKTGKIVLNSEEPSLPLLKFEKLFDLREGDVFDRKSILKTIEKITNILHNQGYAFAEVTPQFNKNNSDISIDTEILINLDKKIIVNRIDISGNHTTQDDVIRRQMNILEGQEYSKESLIDSISKIKRLGYFSKVDYDIRRHKNNDDKVDVFIEVVETKTGEISIGLSQSNASGASITAGISQKNILGTGNTLKAAISNSDAVKETSVFFLNPYFNNLGHSLSYGFFSKNIEASNLEASTYSISEAGLNFGYGLPTSEKNNIFAEFRSSNINLTCGTDLKNYEAEDCSSEDNLDINISLTNTYNSLSDFYFPTNGSKNQIKTTLGLPFSDLKYYKFESSFKKYSPIFDDKVFKFSSRLNFASGYGGNSLPFYKRYFEGGASSIRGFDFNSLGSKYINDKPKGGEFSLISSAGISSTMDFLGVDNENMRIIGFLDAGTISEKISDITFDELRASVGVQFSWLTPIGPIGLNFAEPILKKSNDKTESFAFELGKSF